MITTLSQASPTLLWERLPDLPDPIGLKGVYAGVSGGQLIAAGGSNFPVPHAQGGAKTFARAIYTLPVAAGPGAAWQSHADALPAGLAEGASVTTEHGVVGVGGAGAAGPVADAFLIEVKNEGRGLSVTSLPSLPEPSAMPAAAYLGGYVYVAGGENRGAVQSQFRRLNLAAARGQTPGATWESLPTWPGPPRFGAVLATLRVGGRDCLVLAGGRIKSTPPVRQEDYLADVYGYDPEAGRWQRLADMPHRALAAAVLRLDAGRLAVLGGSDGHSLDRLAELGPKYRLPSRIMIYQAASNAWVVDAGSMPTGTAGTAVVEMLDGGILIGGEYSPGLRIPHVLRATFARASVQSAR
jgi:N-acetylneuraminic acid mutarotase